jgi:hypothetical protein
MARQDDSCWRCGTLWASEDKPALRLILGDGDADRRTNEGGSFASEVALAVAAIAPTR